MRGYLQQTSGMIGEITLYSKQDLEIYPLILMHVCRNYFKGCLRKDGLEKDVAMGVTGAVFNSLPLEFTAYLDRSFEIYRQK
jgi:hypothetical protein